MQEMAPVDKVLQEDTSSPPEPPAPPTLGWGTRARASISAQQIAVEDTWAPLLEQARVLLDAEAAATSLEPATRRPVWALPAVGAIGGVAFAIVLAITPFFVVPVLPRARFGALPWLVTSPKRLASVMDALKPGVLGRGRVFVDLGSGDGGAVLAAARRGATSRGVELNPTLVLASRLAAWRAAPDVVAAGGNASFHFGNLFAHPVADADVIMIFGMRPVMARVAAKLDAEAKPGAVVVSYRYPLPGDNWAAREHSSSVDDVHVYCSTGSPLR